MSFLFINKTLRLNYLKTGTVMHTKNSVLVISSEGPGRFPAIAGNAGNHGNDGQFHESHKMLNQI